MTDCAEPVACPVVVATAGHVDHGKSALIEALTGVNPDRLAIERKRGMTVELGFGELALPSGRLVGLVDVPGHAHYLRAMIQGATGADVAIIAISAVEGVMPQTREHIRILELLGVRHAVVALTMCDLADAEMLELSQLDVEEFLETTAFSGARIIPVSARTGAGLDELRGALDECADGVLGDRAGRVNPHAAGPRLAVDRCFIINGAGTVVTGTLRDGSVRVGDELVSARTGACVRVRGIQVHGDTDHAESHQRTALNIVGETADIARGDVLCLPGACVPTRRIIAKLTYTGRDGNRPVPLKSGTRVHVMAGTAEVMGRIMFFEGEPPMAGGETRAVQLRLDAPLFVRAGDGFIVLAESPIMLLGGGTVLLSQCRRSRTLNADERSLLKALSSGEINASVLAWLQSRSLPVLPAALSRALDLSPMVVQSELDQLAQSGSVLKLPTDSAERSCYCVPAVLEDALEHVAQTLEALHDASPNRTGFSPDEVIRAAWPKADEEVGRTLLRQACDRGICSVEGTEVFDPRSAAGTRRALKEACAVLQAHLDRAGFGGSSAGQLSEACNLDAATTSRAVRELLLASSAIKIGRDVVISAAAEQRARLLVADAIAAAGGAATTSVLKEALGISRKPAIALLEYFDRTGFTVLDKTSGGLRSLR